MFLLSAIFDIFSLTHKNEVVWSDGTQPMLFAESGRVTCQSVMPVAASFFSVISTVFGFFLYT